MRPDRLFLLLALMLGTAHAVTTPPLYVPDEVGHLWRAVSIAHGTLVLQARDGRAVAPLPKGYQLFVFCLTHRDLAGKPELKLQREQYDTAKEVTLQAETMVVLPVGSTYGAANYLPQIAAALIGRAADLRPFVTFYLGRFFALAAFIALVVLAIRVTPFLRWGFVAVALLPMTLYQAASWSADSLTIALSFLVTALALRGAAHVAEPVAAFFLGACKPPYLLLTAIALTKKRWVPLVAALAGFGVTYWLASRTGALMSVGSGQRACIANDPLLLPRVLLRDLFAQGALYAEQAMGRLGHLDVPLPRALVWLEWLLLIALAATAGEKPSRAQRLAAFACVATIFAGISTSLYLSYTPACAPLIEGIQGRYFLPIVPAFLVAIGNPRWRWRKPEAVVVGAIALVVNAVAIHSVHARYYWQ